MAKKAETETEITTPPVSKFTKQQILKAERYQERRDLLTVLLKDDAQYTHDDIQALIDDFMKGQVK